MHVVQQHRLARSAFLERAPPSRPRAAENSNDPYLMPTQSRVFHNALIDGFNFSCDSRMGRMGWLSLGAGFACVETDCHPLQQIHLRWRSASCAAVQRLNKSSSCYILSRVSSRVSSRVRAHRGSLPAKSRLSKSLGQTPNTTIALYPSK